MNQPLFFYTLKPNFKCLTRLMLLWLSVSAVSVNAAANTLSCGAEAQQQSLGALSDFDSKQTLLTGFNCQTTPYISSYLGNWFPSLPEITYSQGSRSHDAIDDIKQDWRISLGIKHIAQGQFYIFADQSLSKFTLEANNNISFIPKNSETSQQAVLINTKQNVRISHQKNSWGFGLQFPFIEKQPLTKVFFRQSSIDQPMQADILGMPERSLFETTTTLSEIEIASQSFHRGLNINWKFAMGMGEIEVEPKALTAAAISKEQNKIISLSSGLEAYYHYRINRRWFAYTRGTTEIHYWHQAASDESFELEAYQRFMYQADIGIGMSF